MDLLNFEGMRFPIDVVLGCIRWYAAYTSMSSSNLIAAIMTMKFPVRSTLEFLHQVHSSADIVRINNSECVREAVRENERVMAERLAALSCKLTAKHTNFNVPVEVFSETAFSEAGTNYLKNNWW